MAYQGILDAVNLAIAIKLFILSVAAAFSDFWHPDFHRVVNANLVLIMILVFIAMLLAIANVVAISLAIFVTEAVRTTAMVTAGSCLFFYLLVLLVYSNSLVGLASPWLLVMLTCPLTVLLPHQIIIHMKMLDDCPLYKLAMSALMAFMCLLSISLSQWWVVQPNQVATQAAKLSMFSLPSSSSATSLQTSACMAFVCLLILLGLCSVDFAVSKNYLSSNPLGDDIPAYCCSCLLSVALVFCLSAVISYCSLTRYTNSLLAAVCMFDSALSVLYQLFSSETLLIC